MKLLLALVVIIASFNLAKAQDHTLGKSKKRIRNMIQPNTGINLLKGGDSDTLTMHGGLQTVMYYKNDTCYTSKSILPLPLMYLMVDKMNIGYKQIKKNTWISPSGLVKVDLTINKEKNQFYVETNWVNKDIKKP